MGTRVEAKPEKGGFNAAREMLGDVKQAFRQASGQITAAAAQATDVS